MYITNPDVINKYEYRSNYLGAKVTETDDWCFKKRKDGCVNVNGYNAQNDNDLADTVVHRINEMLNEDDKVWGR